MLPPLCSDDRRRLLSLARTALTEVVLHQNIPDAPAFTGRLAEPGGAFVTLYCKGRLRGCVGMSGRDQSLGQTVIQSAISAARSDPRFKPVGAEELPGVEIEMSVLSEPRAIAVDAIEVGTHGLLVARGKHRGLLLPQVAVERGWTATRFLEETCRKAGLDVGAWKQPDTQVLAFTADVFSEKEEGSRVRTTGPAGIGLPPGREGSCKAIRSRRNRRRRFPARYR